MAHEQCPSCNEPMTSARHKDAEFDDGDNEMSVTLTLHWCPSCRFVDRVDIN